MTTLHTARQHYAPPPHHGALQRRAQAAYGLVLAIFTAAAMGTLWAMWATCEGVC